MSDQDEKLPTDECEALAAEELVAEWKRQDAERAKRDTAMRQRPYTAEPGRFHEQPVPTWALASEKHIEYWEKHRRADEEAEAGRLCRATIFDPHGVDGLKAGVDELRERVEKLEEQRSGGHDLRKAINVAHVALQRAALELDEGNDAEAEVYVAVAGKALER